MYINEIDGWSRATSPQQRLVQKIFFLFILKERALIPNTNIK
jgi:hypothetical protein